MNLRLCGISACVQGQGSSGIEGSVALSAFLENSASSRKWYFSYKWKYLASLAVKDYYKGRLKESSQSCHISATVLHQWSREERNFPSYSTVLEKEKSGRGLLSVYSVDQMANSPRQPSRGAASALLSQPRMMWSSTEDIKSYKYALGVKFGGFKNICLISMASIFASSGSDFLTVPSWAEVAFSSHEFVWRS